MYFSVSKFPGLFCRAVAKRPMVGQTGIPCHGDDPRLPPSVGPTRRHSHGRGRTARISHVNRTSRTTMERYPLWTTRSCVDPSPVQEFEIQSKNFKFHQRIWKTVKEFEIQSKIFKSCPSISFYRQDFWIPSKRKYGMSQRALDATHLATEEHTLKIKKRVPAIIIIPTFTCLLH